MSLIPPTSTKEKILHTAIDLFSKKGYSGVSIREITKEVGIKESSLYNHFQNKDEILDTIFTLFEKEVGHILPSVDTLDSILLNITPEEFFLQGIQLYKRHIADHPVISKIFRILQIEQYRDSRARDILLELYTHQTLAYLEVVFQKMMDYRQIHTYDTRFLASEYQYAIFAMLSEYQLLTFNEFETNEIERRMEEHVHFFIQRIKR